MLGRQAHIIIFTLLMLCSFLSKGQGTLTQQKVEQRSYSLHMTGDWKGVISIGDSALKQGIDYYYLRFRMGYAQYHLKKYYHAISHFAKAIEFNEMDEISARYLYLLYSYTEQYEQARKLASELSEYSQGILLYKKEKILNYVGLNPGLKQSVSPDVPLAKLFAVSAGHYFINGISFNHQYSRFTQSNDDWDFSQNEYFMQSNVPLFKNHLLSLSFHYVASNTSLHYPFYNQELSSQGWAASAYMNKRILNHSFSIGSTGFEIDSIFQMQHDVTYSYYPFSNNKLELGAKAYLHTNDFYDEINFSFLPFVQFKPTYKLSFFGGYLHNRGNNIAEWNGAIINNSPDLTTGKLTLATSYLIIPKLSISVAFEKEFKESNIFTDYTYNSFFVSLKYIP